VRYLLLLADEPGVVDAMAPEERRRIVEAHMELVEQLRSEGRLVFSAALDPDRAVVLSHDAAISTDGPFAETKEVLGGFYVIDVASEDEARSVEARLPRSSGMRVLLVPVVDV
jgi:hypothetical protein